MRKVMAFLAGLSLGVMFGGVMAILFAPLAGPELQEQVRQSVEKLVEEGRSAATARRLELEAQLESMKQGRPITLQNDAA